MDNWRLTHRFYRQELGYRGANDHTSAGPYILVESHVARSCFPNLSQGRKNDTVPILCEVEQEKEPLLLPFVYHNSKIVENRVNGRNEYRLYVADLRAAYPELVRPGNIIEITPLEVGPSGDLKLRISLVPSSDPRTGEFGPRKNNIFEKLYGKPIPTAPLIEDAVRRPVSVSETIIAKLLDLEIVLPPGRREAPSTVSAIRDAAFRKVVIDAYQNNCALTGKSMGGAGLFSVEAAHIVPVADGGSDNPRNGIPLTRDLHWAFDRGFFTFDRSNEVILHPGLAINSLWPDLGSYRLLPPSDNRLIPDSSALEWHRRNVFGRFASM